MALRSSSIGLGSTTVVRTVFTSGSLDATSLQAPRMSGSPSKSSLHRLAMLSSCAPYSVRRSAAHACAYACQARHSPGGQAPHMPIPFARLDFGYQNLGVVGATLCIDCPRDRADFAVSSW